MKRNKQKEEILLRKHCELDVWLRTKIQEEEVGKDGGMQDRRQDLAWHTNGNGGRRPKLVLQAAERGGKDGEAIPTELHLPHEFWLQGWTCPGTDVCLDKTHSEHVADLSLQPGMVWPSHIPDSSIPRAEQHCFKSSAPTSIHPCSLLKADLSSFLTCVFMGVTCRVRYLHPGPSTTSTLCLFYLRQSAVSEQLFILLEVLHFINHTFRLAELGFPGLILHNHNSWWLHLSFADPGELLPANQRAHPCWKDPRISSSPELPPARQASACT